MENQSQITCPSCSSAIDVQDVLKHQIEEQIKKDFNLKLVEEKKKFEKKEVELQKAQSDFEAKKKKENELFQERLEKQVKEEKRTLEIKLKAKLEEEQADQLAELQRELNEKSSKLKELNKSKAEIERLKREKDALKDEIEAESEKKLSSILEEEKLRIHRIEEEKNSMKLLELQKQLDDQKKLTEEMKRKQEQGSMQMQGEVQELAIEDYLASTYPLDSIEEIKKGTRGADCLQIVNTREVQNCGAIYYESKRTKDFQSSWIEKFKADIRDKGADIGILVTEAMPADMPTMGVKKGIWICSFEEFKGLSLAIREQIINVNNAIASQENKGDKMEMLYSYLTSNEFKMQIEAIVEGFSQMKTDLESEKRSMQRIWKQREKQIDKVVTNTIDMYGSVKGIAGNAIQDVPALELSAVELES